MKKIVIVIVMALFAVFMLTGCKSGSAEPVYSKDDTQIKAKAGESFQIELEKNPTTGYEWTMANSDESVVKLSSDEYKSTNTDPDVVGAGGVHTYTFEALKTGTATITFIYERSFEEDSAAETIVYTVTVE